MINITLDFGAKGDGKTINTLAINNAIKTCHDEGGGTVFIPHGNFVSGTMVLLSNVHLYLGGGAVISGSKDTSDYLSLETRLFSTEGYNRYGMIYAKNAKNISITGEGEINGNGTYFMNSLDKAKLGKDYDRKFIRQGEDFMKPGTVFEDGPLTYPFRPGLLMTISHCENVQIKDITIKDSPEWTVRIADCDDVKITGVTISNNPLLPNNDGIHCTVSSNVIIANCTIVTGDDGIIVTGFGRDASPETKTNTSFLYGNKTGYSENVTVSNCILSSRSACIRIGYGDHPIRNVVFSNLVMYASNRGIGIFSRNNSSIENIHFSNIVIHTRMHSGHWWGKGEPIHLSAVKNKQAGNAGKIRNIRFSDITATSETGIVIQGSKESIIENISMDRIKLTINKGKYTDSYGGNFDLRPAYPMNIAIFKHDIPGVYAQHISNLKISGFELGWGSGLPSFFTNGIELDQFADVTIANADITPSSKAAGLAAIVLTNGTNASVINCSTKKGFQLVKKTYVQ